MNDRPVAQNKSGFDFEEHAEYGGGDRRSSSKVCMYVRIYVMLQRAAVWEEAESRMIHLLTTAAGFGLARICWPPEVESPQHGTGKEEKTQPEFRSVCLTIARTSLLLDL